MGNSSQNNTIASWKPYSYYSGGVGVFGTIGNLLLGPLGRVVGDGLDTAFGLK